MGRGLSDAQRAARAWYAANGDRERAHTTGVWLRAPRAAGADPQMVVAVDSGLLAADLGTNKDLYLSRLANYGVRVSDIRFQVARRASDAPGVARGDSKDAGEDAPPLPDLSGSELSRVESACSELPEGVRDSASRAMCASLRRNKARNT